LVVGIWRWKWVGKLSWALDDFTLVVWLVVVVLVLLSHGLSLIDGVGNTNERTPWNSGEGMAGRANFGVNLETTAKTIQQMSVLTVPIPENTVTYA
jgi:hypothetical protein